jgi:lysophospholipase L1-like esterase
MALGKRLRSEPRAHARLWRLAALLASGIAFAFVTGVLALILTPRPTERAAADRPMPPSAPMRGVETVALPEQPKTNPAERRAVVKSSLDPFYASLFALESGSKAAPLTILHLGDSHIAADRITGEVRRLLQARFGDAGRGLMMPGFPFPYYQAPGFSFEKTGSWTAANSLTQEGTYGITGVNLTADAPDATLTLSSTSSPFSGEVSLLAAPGHGQAIVTAGEERKEVATAADETSVLRVAFPDRASSLKIEVVGDGPVTVLGWSAYGKQRGVRYVNLGIPSASVLTTDRFDRKLAASDIAALAPKLVVLGYGTNEGFNDNLNLAAYEREYARLIKLVKSAAPDAALLILGPTDGNRLPHFVQGDDRAEAPCRPLNAAELADYGDMLSHDDAALARWHEPPKLDALRALLQQIAERNGAAYLSLAEIMGGPCSIDRWVHAEPRLALPDHVHLSDEGSRRVGRAIYQALMAGYGHYRNEARAGSNFAAADRANAAPKSSP